MNHIKLSYIIKVWASAGPPDQVPTPWLDVLWIQAMGILDAQQEA